MTTELMTQCGGKRVNREELWGITPPLGTDTWFPVSHAAVISTVEESLGQAGFTVRKQQFAVARDGHRMFATFDLTSGLVDGVAIAVGVRNSTDKSFPLGFCAGNRVFVCDNLAFSAELLVKRKHTRFGEIRFGEAIQQAVGRLEQFRVIETNKIERLQDCKIDHDKANSLILQTYEAGLISSKNLPGVISEWREPSHGEFAPRTLWSLFNAYTHILKPRQVSNAQQFAAQTMDIQEMFLNVALASKPELVQVA